MRKVNFDQGSKEWLEWRKSLLTATDAAMLLGKSPYVTPYQGWQRKKGLIPEQVSNPAMERGQRDEPIARDLFIKEYGINMTPCCIESEEYNFIGASLDGLSECGEYILEVKSQKPVEKIPEMHMMQMQHQMISTDKKVKKAFYVSHWNGENTTFEVYPDLDWQKEYLPKAKEFWESIVFCEPPKMTDKDYKNMNDNPMFVGCKNEYRQVCETIDELEKKKSLLKDEMILICGEQSSFAEGIKLIKKITRGRIEYDKVEELKSINLEKYRRGPTTSWCVLIDQKKESAL